MRAVGALIVIVLGCLPALFAGVPATEPGVFASSVGGVPLGVWVMCLLMVVFIGLASWCSSVARDSDRKAEGR